MGKDKKSAKKTKKAKASKKDMAPKSKGPDVPLEIIAMVRHLGRLEGHGVPEDLHQDTLDIWFAGLGAKLRNPKKDLEVRYDKLVKEGRKMVKAVLKHIEAENKAKIKKPTYRIGRDPHTGRFIRIEEAEDNATDGIVIILRKRGKAKPFKRS